MGVCFVCSKVQDQQSSGLVPTDPFINTTTDWPMKITNYLARIKNEKLKVVSNAVK